MKEIKKYKSVFPVPLYEMATVDVFHGWKVVVYPSGSESNPKGGRKEHGPPHFTIIKAEFNYTFKIPSSIPKSISDFELKDEKDEFPNRKITKYLLEWINGFSFMTDENGNDFKISNFGSLIRQWNKENPLISIKTIRDEKGKITGYTWNGKRKW